jgi:GNAT acetyltransferase
MHVNVLFTHDAQERLTGINEWRGGTAPHFYLGRTVTGNVCRFHANLPDELINELKTLCLEESGNILSEPKHKEDYIHLLSAHNEITKVWQGPAYWRSHAIQTVAPTVMITNENVHLLENGLQDWIPDVPHWQPFLASLEDDRAVAVCASVRTNGKATEAGVETLKNYRRKGHAANAVAVWANTLLQQNTIPLYSTSWDNIASQNVAKKLGFSLYGTDFHIT